MTWYSIGNVARLVGGEEWYTNGELETQIWCELHVTPICNRWA